MKRIFHKLHLWLSIPFGIIISILCLTGALLVFESDIKEFVSPSLYKANIVRESPLSIDQLIPIVKQQLPDSVVISSVQIPSDSKSNYRFGVTGQGRTYLLVDPYIGGIKGVVNPYAKGDFFSFIRRTHRWFMFEYKKNTFSRGKLITGTTTLVFVFILISGVVIWIPKSVKMVKVRLKIHTGSSCFRFWYDTHIAGGVYVVLLLLVISLTGLTWSFDWYRTGFYSLFGGEQTVSQQVSEVRQTDFSAFTLQHKDRETVNNRRSRETGNHSEGTGSYYRAWTTIANSLQKANPDCKMITVQNGTATVTLGGMGNTRASDTYSFDPYTGEIIDVNYYKDQPKSVRLRGWIYSVHVGTWGGIVTQVIYCIVCLIGATLPWTGYYIYIQKRRNKRREVHVV